MWGAGCLCAAEAEEGGDVCEGAVGGRRDEEEGWLREELR